MYNMSSHSVDLGQKEEGEEEEGESRQQPVAAEQWRRGIHKLMPLGGLAFFTYQLQGHFHHPMPPGWMSGMCNVDWGMKMLLSEMQNAKQS